jgi:hypothetical protein
MNPLQDDELNRALAGLEAPATPPQLEARTLSAYRGRKSPLRSLLTMQIRVPLPVAIVVVGILLGLSITLARIETRQLAPSPQPWGGLQPVSELRPVVIRGQYENQ